MVCHWASRHRLAGLHRLARGGARRRRPRPADRLPALSAICRRRRPPRPTTASTHETDAQPALAALPAHPEYRHLSLGARPCPSKQHVGKLTPRLLSEIFIVRRIAARPTSTEAIRISSNALRPSRHCAKRLGRSAPSSSSPSNRASATEWIKPYTDKTVEALARDGVKSIAIVTPAIAADCIETLEEIAEENKVTPNLAARSSATSPPQTLQRWGHRGDRPDPAYRSELQGWEVLSSSTGSWSSSGAPRRASTTPAASSALSLVVGVAVLGRLLRLRPEDR